MKAMLLSSIAPIESRPLTLTDVPEPEPGPGEIRIKIASCAVCRTDLHIIEGDLPQAKLPVIPGHQMVGTVDRLGPDVSQIELGERVGIAWLRLTCGVCHLCRTGHENLCRESKYTGYHVDGGFTEYAVVPEWFAYPIPPVFSDEEAAPLLCGGIIGYRALKRANLMPSTNVALYGFGSSAHIALQIARYHGCNVYVFTRGEERRQLALDMGATWAGPSHARLDEKMQSAALFAPSGDLIPHAMENLERGGTLAIAGIHISPPPALDYQKHLFQERDLHSVTANTRQDGRKLLEEAAAIPVRPIISTYALSEANDALIDLKQGRVKGTAVLINDL